MRIVRADLHIHTVLSPCADLDMSPDVIVDRAKERQLDLIGITDHNSTHNCQAVAEYAAREGIAVLSGCEVNTSEEIHVLVFFPDFDRLDTFQHYIDQHLPVVENNPEILGFQVIVDADSNILAYEDRYLGVSLDVDIDELSRYVRNLGGIFIPAHVDRPINSLFSQLGFLPEDLFFDALQISKKADEQVVRHNYMLSTEISIVKFSDAHYPENIGEVYTLFEMQEVSFDEFKKALQRIDGRCSLIPQEFSK